MEIQNYINENKHLSYEDLNKKVYEEYKIKTIIILKPFIFIMFIKLVIINKPLFYRVLPWSSLYEKLHSMPHCLNSHIKYPRLKPSKIKVYL